MLSVASLKVDANFGNTGINLPRNLTINGGYIKGGTITGTGASIQIDVPNGEFAWTKGYLDSLFIVVGLGTQFKIDPGAGKTVTLNDTFVVNKGTINLASGTLTDNGTTRLMNFSTGVVVFNGADGIASSFNPTTFQPTTTFTNVGLVDLVATPGVAISYQISPNFRNSGTILIQDSTTLALSGGGEFDSGMAKLGGPTATLQFNANADAKVSTAQVFFDYNIQPAFSLAGTGAWMITSGMNNDNVHTRDAAANLIAGTNLTLPASIALLTNGGYIRGPGSLTIQSPLTPTTGSVLQNTILDSGAIVNVASGATLAVKQSGAFPQGPNFAARVSGATLSAKGTGNITITDANLYIGTNGLLQLTAVGNDYPRVTFSGKSNILEPAGANAAMITVNGGQFFNNNPNFTPKVVPFTKQLTNLKIFPSFNNITFLHLLKPGGANAGKAEFTGGVLHQPEQELASERVSGNTFAEEHS